MNPAAVYANPGVHALRRLDELEARLAALEARLAADTQPAQAAEGDCPKPGEPPGG